MSLRPWAGNDSVTFATKTSLRALGRRVQALDAERVELDAVLGELVTGTAPKLLALHGVGIKTAVSFSLLLATTLNGCAAKRHGRTCVGGPPIIRHRRERRPVIGSIGVVTVEQTMRCGGSWLTRMSNDPRTRAYVERRTVEGKSKREVMRILKRYIAREVYPFLPRS